MKSVLVVIPTTGSPHLLDAVSSVVTQTYENTQCLVVVDGPEYQNITEEILREFPQDKVTIMTLPWNTGAGGYNGQYIYASAGMLMKQDYLCPLDQDNWYEAQHVETCMDLINRNVSWCHSLRNIVDKSGEFLGKDDCESLGRWGTWIDDKSHLVDTSCYCVSREIAQQAAPAWLKLWGEDRQFYSAVSHGYRNFACTGKYTVNYRLGGNPNSVKWEFFQQGNATQQQRYPHGFPWKK